MTRTVKDKGLRKKVEEGKYPLDAAIAAQRMNEFWEAVAVLSDSKWEAFLKSL